MDEHNESFKVVATVKFVMFAGEVECLGNTGSAEGIKKRIPSLVRCERRGNGEVVCHYETIIVFWEVWESEDVEDFIGKGRDKGWFCEVFYCSLNSQKENTVKGQ